MAAAASKKPCQGDVEIAETLTILEGVKMAAGGLSPLIIKADSQSVVHSILIGISSRGELDWIISEIRTLVDKDNQYRVVYAPRPCNSVVYGITKIVLSISKFLI